MSRGTPRGGMDGFVIGYQGRKYILKYNPSRTGTRPLSMYKAYPTDDGLPDRPYRGTGRSKWKLLGRDGDTKLLFITNQFYTAGLMTKPYRLVCEIDREVFWHKNKLPYFETMPVFNVRLAERVPTHALPPGVELRFPKRA